jgi:hypothetical protein
MGDFIFEYLREFEAEFKQKISPRIREDPGGLFDEKKPRSKISGFLGFCYVVCTLFNNYRYSTLLLFNT